jgi:type II secretion system protein I
MILQLRKPRRGISLLEVLAAFAIFMVSYVAISELINMSVRSAILVELQELATLKAETKLAEVVVGAVPLSSQQEASFDEDPDWTWSLDCTEHGDIPGLWNVQVRVTRVTPEGHRVESVLSQMVLDPSTRGSTMDSTTISGTETMNTGATSGTPTTGGGQ